MEDNIKIDVLETMYILNNAKSMYETLKNNTTVVADSDPHYLLTVMSLLSVYRNTLEVKVEDNLLIFYIESVKALINEDEKYFDELYKILNTN